MARGNPDQVVLGGWKVALYPSGSPQQGQSGDSLQTHPTGNRVRWVQLDNTNCRHPFVPVASFERLMLPLAGGHYRRVVASILGQRKLLFGG